MKTDLVVATFNVITLSTVTLETVGNLIFNYNMSFAKIIRHKLTIKNVNIMIHHMPTPSPTPQKINKNLPEISFAFT